MSILQFPDMESLQQPVIDFHRHLSPICGEEAIKYKIKEMCIMPSWMTETQFQEKVQPINDFTEVDQYITQLKTFTQHTQNWHGKIYPFIPLNFTESVEVFANRIQQLHPTGIKLHPLQNFPIDKKMMTPYMELVQNHNLIVYIHGNWVPRTEFNKNVPTIFKTFGKIAGFFPGITFIMGHAGLSDSFLFAANVLKEHPNCFVETSLSPSTWQLERVVHEVSPTKLLFGSNSPFANPAVEIFKILSLHKVSDEEKTQILYSNAKELLKTHQHMEV